MEEEEFTTVRISKRNKDRLDGLGKKCDTHDDIICRMMDVISENNIDINISKRKKHGSSR
jgi:hypothetical protein